MPGRSGQFLRRCRGALLLDAPTYRALSVTRDALPQAAAIVLVIGLLGVVGPHLTDGTASGVIPVDRVQVDGWPPLLNAAISGVGSLLVVVAGWGLEALVLRALGRRLGHSSTQWSVGAVAAPIGFARLTGLAYVLTFVPPLSTIGMLIATLWGIGAGVVLTRTLFSVSTGRALVLSLLTLAIVAVPQLALYVSLRQ
jgi:hypothetical protein